jgi:hypothetical protein
MGKRVLTAVLWGMAIWTWVSMAHVFVGTPDVGMVAGLGTAALIMARGVLPRSPLTFSRQGRLARSNANRSRSHA